MKKLCLFLIVLLSSLFSFSQNVAINDDGTDPNNSAMLDVKSSSKGILIPRLTSSQKNGILLPGTGLLVYQIDGVQGFYYNSGTPGMPLWLLITNQNTGWQTDGNAGTNPTVNFIGTIDNQPLQFKVNRNNAGFIGNHNDANTFYGYNSGSSIGLGNIGVGSRTLMMNNGNNNVAIGSTSMLYNTTGFVNTAVGTASLHKNTEGSGNVAVGTYTLNQNIQGSSNSAFGYGSLQKSVNGHMNTAIGHGSLISNIDGSNNTALGADANVGNGNLSNATAIGSRAKVDCNNCLVLGSVTGANNATSSVAVGIGTTNPNATAALEINSTQKGLLIPRMTMEQRNAINTPATGLLIFQTNGTAGLYSYTNGAWAAVTPTITPSWNIGGNAGIDPNSQFIGTTDNQPLVFKINNMKAGKLDLINTSFGVNTLSGNNPGESNVAIGNFALQNNSANYNAAFGNRSMWYNVSGQNNSAFGYGSLIQNTTGSSNTAIGNSTLNANTLGNSNTAIGSFADVGEPTLVNATSIGANARADCNDCLVLGSIAGINNATTSTRVGIGNSDPEISAALEINSNNKGILIPRMTMMETLNIPNPATGLLVYITDNPSGFFYNNGSPSSPDWKNILASNSGWALGGNDIDPSRHNSTIGTRNKYGLTFMVNGSTAGYIDPENTSTSFGYESNPTYGEENVAIGYRALTGNSEGISNVAIGRGAQSESFAGFNNVSVGTNTLKTLNDGGGNTAIGFEADVNDPRRMNATAIGAYSRVDCDNCLVLGNVNSFDQNYTVRTGIGTTNPHASAALEIESTKRGLLIPRMTQTQRNAIASPVNGLIIYQTDNEPGIYAYNGTTWNAVTPNTSALLANTWGTNGNSGTDPALNFIGTIDNKPLTFKTNNELSGYIDPLLNNVLFGRLQDANIQGITNSVGIGNNALSTNWEGAEGLIGIGNKCFKRVVWG